MLTDSGVSRNRCAAVVLLSVWFCGSVSAGLTERILKVADPQKAGDYSIHIVESESGTVIYSYNARKPLIPASNMKLVTTAAALKYLGADFTYITKVGLCGDTLVVIGSGDPLLGDKETDAKYGRQNGWIFERITQTLQAKGITEINDIIVDTTVFDNERVHPSWPARDHNKWYACEVSGLNYNGNCIEVTANNVGGIVTVEVEPRTTFVEIVNDVEAIADGAGAVGANRNVRPNKITVFGQVKTRQGPFKVAIQQPAAFFGVVLAEHLVRAGIAARGRVIEKAFDETARFDLLVGFATPITDVINRANTDSFGLAVEALFKTIDASDNPDRKNGGWAGGREAIARYLADLGVPPEEFNIDDGSGLSRANRLTTSAISQILLESYRGENWELFRTSLAVGGEDGTIDKYFKEAKYRGRIHGKTGYISGVRSFSGVCLTDNGPYLFSILSNGPKGLSRDAINDVAKAIIDEFANANAL